ncbi:hypothetical protein JOF28_001673 [Leucobacter exalbidus]|uniref:DUF2804 domain-containing protein n=1 Tax=Leucobacter exalbidus TaxID=662960 RepID=A0A940PYF7_9MICO|nr:DUF2804 domain-containing protein [Leucobacter exalbidus]MBP1326441.1 hypothetical protein [Leucobacter exalbidus]
MSTQAHALYEPKIEGPAPLVGKGNRLNPAAIGWATQPIIDTASLGGGRGRNKRWEYWNVMTPTHIIALTVSSIDYACVHEVWVLDRSTGREWHKGSTLIPARGATLAPRLEQGSSSARDRGLAIDIDEVPGGTRLRAEIGGASFDIVAELPAGHERLALVVPWSQNRFQYTVKDVARPASGTLRLDGVEIAVPAGESWAVLDHGRGRWPYDIQWNWGAGSGRSHGRVIGVQVGAEWTASTSVSENAFFVDGIMHKIHGETSWQYDIENWRTPWRITGGGLDATFTPNYNKRSRTNFVVLSGRTDQCFGEWSGTFTTAAGERIEFAGIEGWAEEVHNRW